MRVVEDGYLVWCWQSPAQMLEWGWLGTWVHLLPCCLASSVAPPILASPAKILLLPQHSATYIASSLL